MFPPAIEELFEPLRSVSADGKTYTTPEVNGSLQEQAVLTLEADTGRCVHGLPRRTCAICNALSVSRTAGTRVPRRLDVFDLILPVLQPPLGVKFDSVLAFAPGQELYDFQRYGVAWSAQQSQALLADEMGLGKSIQAIVGLRVLFRQARILSTLILCPKSILTDWERKLKIWSPELRVQVVRGQRELRELQWSSQAHVHVATYESLRQDSDLVEPNRFNLVIVDEIQRIKNPETGVAQSVRRLGPSVRWGLSGTPLENRLDDLVAIFAFLSPGLLRSHEVADLARVKRKIEPYVLRRRKAEALKDLPEKVVGEAWVELTDGQRIRYEDAERLGVLDLKGLGEKITITHVFSLINHLKQICNMDPVTGESAKLDFVKPRLEHIAEQGDKALVFSQFPAKTLARMLVALEGFGAQLYDGSLSERERDRVLEAFKQGAERAVLLLSVKAGGLGLSLTEANYVFHMDLWWNPATATQAEDRTHRIGQTKKVFVQYIYTVDTIEERIRKLVEQKRQLFREVIDQLSDVALSKILTEDELFGLFELQRPRAKPEPISILTPRGAPVQDPHRYREQLAALERGLRRLIEKRLSALTPDWWVSRTPSEVRREAERRQSRNESSWPWLTPNPASPMDYVDFSDYRKIIEREDNWTETFRDVLLHREIVLGKLLELEPIRNSLAHNRELSEKEKQVLSLNVEHLMILIEKEIK